MKSLDLKQMEKVQGGNALWSCAAVPALATIGIAATILTSGLFGFAAALAVGSAATGCAIAVSDGPR